MKYINTAEDFFSKIERNETALSALKEAFSRVPRKDLILAFETASLSIKANSRKSGLQESSANLNHQFELLSAFESLEEINSAEAILLKNGYEPVFLTLEGAYIETLTVVKQIGRAHV